MAVFRTPDSCFSNLSEYPFRPHYINIQDPHLGALRVHYVDEGSPSDITFLLLHGEPSWSYLYRKMIPPLAAAGYRVVAPDLIGFGKSDKPTRRESYSYAAHIDWLQKTVFDALNLQNIVLFCQDWGGLLGLRLVAAAPQRFRAVIVGNTFLPTGNNPASDAFMAWRKFSQEVPTLPVGKIVRGGTTCKTPPEPYDAPYPNEESKAGARMFPTLVPITPSDPQASENAAAWPVLRSSGIPFLTLFSDSDPITAGGDKAFKAFPSAANLPHKTISGAAHFLQEDAGPELAQEMLAFVAKLRPQGKL